MRPLTMTEKRHLGSAKSAKSALSGEPTAGGTARRLALALAPFVLLVFLGCGETGSAGKQEAVGGHGSAGEQAAAHLDDATLLEILQHPDMLMRIEKIAAHLQTLGPDDVAETRKVFESASFDRGDLEYTLFGTWWASFDAPSAQTWADSQMQARHPRVIAAVVRAWAQQDPQGAADSKRFLKVQPGAPLYRADLLDALVVGWFDSGKPGLEDFIQTLGDEDMTRGLQSYARVRAIRDGHRETLEWARIGEGFTEPEQRLLMAGALTVTSMQKPKLAAEYLDIAKADGVDTRTFVSRIAGGWAEFDHEAAMRWLATQEPGPDRNRGMNRVAGVWVRKDRPSLEAYLVENAGKEWMDPVRVLLARRTVNFSKFRPDWNDVMSKVDVIVEDEPRWSARTWVLQRWFVVDEASANAYLLGDSDLPKKSRERARQSSPAIRNQIEKALENSSPLLVN
ncbi:MAG: hypothetical protein AB8G23_18435 [Myxococcota bacterium]